jgi:hypothetical protein
MLMRDQVYEYDEIVIGGSLSALLYSFYKSKPVIFVKPQKPLFFESHTVDLWAKTNFLLNLSGLMPCQENVSAIRIDKDEKILKVVTDNSRMAKFKFESLRVFDDQEVLGLGDPAEQVKNYMVLDWMNVLSGMAHEHDVLESGDDFVNKVYFYPSKRMDRSKDRKDAVAISFLNDQQLKDFEYSDTYARFKTLAMMKEAGIRGARNGKDPNRPGKYKYYALKIETAHRDVKQIKMHKYENESGLVFDYRQPEEILKNSQKIESRYAEKINKMIYYGRD